MGLVQHFLWNTMVNLQGSAIEAKLAKRPDDGGVIEYYYDRPNGSQILVFVCTGKARVNDDAALKNWSSFLEPHVPCAVMIHNYPGRGKSSNCRYKDSSQISIEEQILEDNQTLLQLLRDDGWAMSQIVLIGNSIGNGPVVDMLCDAKEPFAHTILISPYKNLHSLSIFLEVAKHLGSSEAAAFNSYSKLQELVKSDTKQPVSLISSDGDATISSKHSEDIFGIKNCWCTWYCLQGVSHRHTRPAARDVISGIVRDPKTQPNKKVDIAASSILQVDGSD
ncbi:hypothetical protein V500_02204 [Pseudogymnoascus sp. VKM F-4518 (FW-2643)]|nr:hypothetical protein V500_02204 [Pseudogymnoascus sp. VKM F-4518 (FW-2643)]